MFFFFSFLQNQRTGRQNRLCPRVGGYASGRERCQGKVNTGQKKCVHMYVNAKMICGETIPEMGV
jgi:hypothetical protein